MKRILTCLLAIAAASAIFTSAGCSGQETKTTDLEKAKRADPPTTMKKNAVNWKTGE